MDVCAELHRAVQGRSAALQSGDLEEYLVSLSLRNMTLFHERHFTIGLYKYDFFLIFIILHGLINASI